MILKTILIPNFNLCFKIFTLIDGDWEADHEKYAKYDEVIKKKWPDGTVSILFLFIYLSKCLQFNIIEYTIVY